jgi:hypothetical protein
MLKKDDKFKPPIMGIPEVPVVDENSWKWTKKSVVLLGSPLITFWRDVFQPVNETIGVSSFRVKDGTGFDLNIPSIFEWQKIKVVASNGNQYTFENMESGINTFYLEGEIDWLHFGSEIEGFQYFYQKWEK